MDNVFARRKVLSSQQRWYLTGYRWALPFLMAVIIDHMLMHRGSVVAWAKAPVLGLLLAFWLLSLVRPLWAMKIDVLSVSSAAAGSLVAGYYLLLGPNPVAGAQLLRELAFWTPVLCAYWTMLLFPRPWLTASLVAAFIFALLLANSHAQAHAIAPILTGTVVQALAQTVILVVMVRVFGAAHASLTDQRNRARHKALRDDLTGLHNRFAFEHELRRTVRLAERHKAVFSLVVMDIDHFKRFNDRFGHLAGDAVLRVAARAFQHVLRQSDLVCRWGGEEFAVILPNTSMSDACRIANKLRLRLAGQHTPVGETVTISCGVATYREGDHPRTIFERADASLLDAKKEGRNRVVCSEEHPMALAS